MAISYRGKVWAFGFVAVAVFWVLAAVGVAMVAA